MDASALARAGPACRRPGPVGQWAPAGRDRPRRHRRPVPRPRRRLCRRRTTDGQRTVAESTDGQRTVAESTDGQCTVAESTDGRPAVDDPSGNVPMAIARDRHGVVVKRVALPVGNR
ncbi:hypothetical protein [Streptomyces sp. NPDC018833]|uniref:hypothetical protein n=1 Tax=Streptomyces sp. NPDC018833 TaxID=3365053 RepID=UPI0037935E07